MQKTLVATPDPDSIRRGRLGWVAQALRLPLTLAGQGLARAQRLTERKN